MGLTVHVAAWQLEEDGGVIAVGDQLAAWLEFRESSRGDQGPDQHHRLTGLARAIPPWAGAEGGRHPTVIDADGATIYWDAPRPVTGPVGLIGVLAANNVDAPDGFPMTEGLVTRVRMEWQDHRPGDGAAWYPVPGTARYEDLQSSYLPHAGPIDPVTRVVWTGVLVDLEVTGT
ncbi:hypothetical protein GHK92_09340 [Nocardioides sp. dk4132]|uniref:hypothetical protein n=1 Tax=unclassified Nocardioides TaxID=2615069 RepID=UPI0012971145|nr:MULTISPECIES: hypothetical protein [unclassified Nocardioides]MQW76078.1 hypothetical protein [Nocardioides sp. dk4132]QGA08926.1 hypothetical protein GFH29_17095 [Nocardioides sp. dk884]